MRHFYYDPNTIDLAKLREDANKCAAGKSGRHDPEPVTIHHHTFVVGGHTGPGKACDGFMHEYYRPEKEAVRTDESLATLTPTMREAVLDSVTATVTATATKANS